MHKQTENISCVQVVFVMLTFCTSASTILAGALGLDKVMLGFTGSLLASSRLFAKFAAGGLVLVP